MEQANSRKSHGAEAIQLTCTFSGSMLVCEDAHMHRSSSSGCFPPEQGSGEWKETSLFNSTKGP